jgi:hypothetical protein
MRANKELTRWKLNKTNGNKEQYAEKKEQYKAIMGKG